MRLSPCPCGCNSSVGKAKEWNLLFRLNSRWPDESFVGEGAGEMWLYFRFEEMRKAIRELADE